MLAQLPLFGAPRRTTIKGKDNPIAVCSCRDTAGAAAAGTDTVARAAEELALRALRARAGLVGRAAELICLGALLRNAHAAGSGVLAVEGAAGVGKSLLVEQVVLAVFTGTGPAAEGRVSGWVAWVAGVRDNQHTSGPGSGSSFGAGRPRQGRAKQYGPFAGLLAEAAGLTRLDSPAERGAALLRYLETHLPGWAPLAPLLSPVVGAGLPALGPEAEARLSGAGERVICTVQLAAAVLGCEARRRGRLCLVVDDASWLDPPSWVLLQAVAAVAST